MAAEYEVQFTTTGRVPARDRAEFWTDHVRFNHGTLDYSFPHPDERSPAGFAGATHVQRCGGHQLVEFWSDRITYARTARHVRGDDDRSMRLFVPKSGALTVTHDGHALPVPVGHAALVSMARPFELVHRARARAWVLTVPEGCLPDRAVADGPSVLDLRRGVGAVAGTMTRALARERTSLSGPAFVAISARVIELVSLALTDTHGHIRPGGLQAVAAAAHAYVDERSDDPDLTPASMARDLGWSLRQLQLALRAAGTTPAELLRNRRLDRARSRLEDPRWNAVSVGGIAFASGFGSLGAFGTAFRARFGTTPKAVRAAGPAAALNAAASPAVSP
ncbi:AraC family transcriptional regulator [Rhodococcus sp. GXMU-t2271]|uniref:AraC family transcriptional regulator n=1 Tax=Rhodococcus indonesiensis TaxID=3055869 RepID=A0ABT7RSE7_9NOCA|nr:AraC family transcriptional regulator [Rhodococcus indonesiensis]MDM7490184.1 AraC family transcriptional regulator [Rhodococcus indonesiensis]